MLLGVLTTPPLMTLLLHHGRRIDRRVSDHAAILNRLSERCDKIPIPDIKTRGEEASFASLGVLCLRL